MKKTKKMGVFLSILLLIMAMITAFPSFAGIAETAPASAGREKNAALSRKAQRAFGISRRLLGLQTELPNQGASKIAPENVRLPELPEPPSWDFWNMSRDTAMVILIAALLAILIGLVPAFRANMWSDSRARELQRQERGEERAPATVAARMEHAQAEADDLARAGDFAGAMHMLLLQSIVELRRRLQIPISISLTSREILHRVALPPEGRESFADIIGRVEISYFGTHRPGASEYAACRRSYDTLTGVLRGEGSH